MSTKKCENCQHCKTITRLGVGGVPMPKRICQPGRKITTRKHVCGDWVKRNNE